MGFISCKFSGHSWHSRNFLVLLVLWHGARPCTKIYPFCGNITHSPTILISWITSPWYFALSILPFSFLRKDRSLLLIARQTCTLTGNFTVVWIHSMIFLILFAANTTMVLIVITQNTDSCECVVVPQMGYILCMILPHAITLKLLEHL